jgi:LysM repeat protein
MRLMRDYYADLQVAPHADDGVITAAYRYLARAYHPDVAGAAGMRRMQALNAAYEVLSDPTRRREYDRERVAATHLEWSQVAGAASARASRPRYLGVVAYTAVTAVCLMVVTVLWVAARPSLDSSMLTGRAGRAATAPVAPAATSPRPRSVSAPRATDGLRRLPGSSTGPDARQKTETQDRPVEAGGESTPSTDIAHMEELLLQPPSEADVRLQSEAASQPHTEVTTVASPKPTSPPVYTSHVVQSGENLSSIAARYGVSPSVITQVNGIPDPDHLGAGAVLLIPTP